MFEKSGTWAWTAGRAENWQISVFLAYATGRGRTASALISSPIADEERSETERRVGEARRPPAPEWLIERGLDRNKHRRDPHRGVQEPASKAGWIVDLMAALNECVQQARASRGEDADVHELPKKKAATKQPAKKTATKKTATKKTTATKTAGRRPCSAWTSRHSAVSGLRFEHAGTSWRSASIACALVAGLTRLLGPRQLRRLAVFPLGLDDLRKCLRAGVLKLLTLKVLTGHGVHERALPLHSVRLDAPLQEAGVIDDQHGIRGAEVFHDAATHVVQDLIGVPPDPVQHPLDPVRAVMTGLFGWRPAVLPLQRSNQSPHGGRS